ncbi:hypothetical protein BC834DRAFT_605939 [Gloeopeniophorella convolvens]|nr:hypothetical protein BC834DRAFT_605939 [Gloeopeniophorella convolvens]
MDDRLVLNLALEEGSSTRSGSAKKGGRRTDRSKRTQLYLVLHYIYMYVCRAIECLWTYIRVPCVPNTSLRKVNHRW